MKKVKFFATAFIALAMFSCSKENPVTDGVEQGKPASISIRIVGSADDSQKSRYVVPGGDMGELVKTESGIDNLNFLVFDAQGNYMGGDYLGSQNMADHVGDTYKIDGLISGKNNKVFAIANLGAVLPETVDNIAALAARTAGLIDQSFRYLTMSGENRSFKLEPGSNSITIPMVRLAARVRLAWSTTGLLPAGASFKPTRAYMLNVKALSSLTGIDSANLTTTELAHGGGDTFTGSITTGSILYNYLNEDRVDDATGNVYFYSFEHKSTASSPSNAKIVLEGSFDPDGAGPLLATTCYYPVQVNINNGSMTTGGSNKGIERNNQYKVTMNIKKQGNDNPWENIDPATLDVAVSVAPWEVEIEQTTTFE